MDNKKRDGPVPKRMKNRHKLASIDQSGSLGVRPQRCGRERNLGLCILHFSKFVTRESTHLITLSHVRSRAASRPRARTRRARRPTRRFSRSLTSRTREMDERRKSQALAPRAVQLPSVSRGRDVAFPSGDARAERYETRTFSRTTVLSGPSSHQGSGTLSGLRAETGACFSSRRDDRASRKSNRSVGERLTMMTLVFDARR